MIQAPARSSLHAVNSVRVLRAMWVRPLDARVALNKGCKRRKEIQVDWIGGSTQAKETAAWTATARVGGLQAVAVGGSGAASSAVRVRTCKSP